MGRQEHFVSVLFIFDFLLLEHPLVLEIQQHLLGLGQLPKSIVLVLLICFVLLLELLLQSAVLFLQHVFLLLSFTFKLEQFGLAPLDGLVFLVNLLLEGPCDFVVVFVVVVDCGSCFFDIILPAIDFCYINASLDLDLVLTDFRV